MPYLYLFKFEQRPNPRGAGLYSSDTSSSSRTLDVDILISYAAVVMPAAVPRRPSSLAMVPTIVSNNSYPCIRLSILSLPNELINRVIEWHIAMPAGRRGLALRTISQVCRLFRLLTVFLVDRFNPRTVCDIIRWQAVEKHQLLKGLSMTLDPDTMKRTPVFRYSAHLPHINSVEVRRCNPDLGTGLWHLPTLFNNFNFPSLQSLTLCNFGIPPERFGSFGHLRHLSLIVTPNVRITFPSPLRMHPIIAVAVIIKLPLLEHLELDGAICSMCSPSVYKDHVAKLDHLRSLRLVNPGRKQLDVFERLIIPTTTTVSLYFPALHHSSHLKQVGEAIAKRIDQCLGDQSDTKSSTTLVIRSAVDNSRTLLLQWYHHQSTLELPLDEVTPDIEVQIHLPERHWLGLVFKHILTRPPYSEIRQLYVEPIPYYDKLTSTQLASLLSPANWDTEQGSAAPVLGSASWEWQTSCIWKAVR